MDVLSVLFAMGLLLRSVFATRSGSELHPLYIIKPMQTLYNDMKWEPKSIE